MKKRNQKGFGAIEVVGVIMVIALVCVGTWLIVDSMRENKTPSDTDRAVDATTQPVAEYEGTMVASVNNRWSIHIPNGWKNIYKCSNSDSLFVSASETTNLTYEQGLAAEVQTTTCGSDSVPAFSVFVNDGETSSEPSAMSFKTTSGLEGTKFCDDNVETSFADEVLLQECTYRFTHSGKTYEVVYVRPDDSHTDHLTLIDQVVRSFKLM